MNGRKALSLALAGIAVMSLAFGTGAFTSVSAERGVSVAVVDDDNAYVGYNSSLERSAVESGDTIPLVEIRNQFAQHVTVTEAIAWVDDDSWDIDVVDSSLADLGSGNDTVITGTVSECDAGETRTAHVTVTVSGSGVWAKIFGESETQDREFEVTCEAPSQIPSNDVVFKGSGQVRINTLSEEQIEVVYWTTEGSPGDDSLSFETHGPENRTPESSGPADIVLQNESQPDIVAVYFPSTNTSYKHPNLLPENETGNNWGAGDGVPVEGNVSLGA
jgi:hypothetical protein